MNHSQSPRSSPSVSSRVSPSVHRQDGSGPLKPITIVCGSKGMQIKSKGHFYLCKDLPEPSAVTGSVNLISHHNLQHAYSKLSSKKTKEDLSSMLSLPGNVNMAASATDDNSSLKSLIDKPPITGKELLPLTANLLTGFRLHPGKLPQQYQIYTTVSNKEKKKKRSLEHERGEVRSSPPAEGEVADVKTEKKPRKTKDKDQRREKRRKEKEKKRRERKKGHHEDVTNTALH